MRLIAYNMFSALVMLAAFDVSWARAVNKPIFNPIGRYQLFQGQYTSYDLKRQQTSTASAVFMIDTVTGVVKRYMNKIDENGRYIETWVTTEPSGADPKRK